MARARNYKNKFLDCGSSTVTVADGPVAVIDGPVTVNKDSL